MQQHLRTMARYNRWANARLSKAIEDLDEADYMAERGAFFGSIHGTVNHLLLVDRLWRGRIEDKPYPANGLDDIVAESRADFLRQRAEEDDVLIDFTDGFDGAGLEREVSYKSLVGHEATDTVATILTHMFNHATHHRGQAHGLLSLVPSEPPPLDLMYYLRDVEKKAS